MNNRSIPSMLSTGISLYSKGEKGLPGRRVSLPMLLRRRQKEVGYCFRQITPVVRYS